MTSGTQSARKIDRGTVAGECPISRGDDGTWQIRGYATARALLRETDTVQAGLGVEMADRMPSRIRRPVIYRDGPEHREHRRQTARFFTPRRVNEHYRDLVERVAEAQVARLREAGQVRLGELTFAMAIEVVCEIIGLTASKPGIQRRLERFFPEKVGTPGLTSLHGLHWLYRQNANWLSFYLGDVRPAIRDHRRNRRDDLITHLLDEGCSGAEILGECLTFAAAGMITTREFTCVAAWHLFADAGLLERYRHGNEPERLDILNEILRLEPVVGSLRRRATSALSLPGSVTIPAGEVVEILVDVANADPDAVGPQPLEIQPGRAVDGITGIPGLSFGDGAHRCPGAGVALLQTDVFLSRLFALPGLGMVKPPRVTFKEDIGGYELRDFLVSIAP